MKLKNPVKLYIDQVEKELGKINGEKWAYLAELRKKAKAYKKKNKKANIGNFYEEFGKPAEAGRRYLEIEDLSVYYHMAKRHRTAVFFRFLLLLLILGVIAFGCYHHIDSIKAWYDTALTWVKEHILSRAG